MDANYFPKDKIEYYYYFRIKNIEEALELYNECNGFMLEKVRETTILEDILSTNDFTKYYTKYKKLYDDFNVTANLLISGESIETTENFVSLINCLMVIANDTIELTQDICRKKEYAHTKTIFNGTIDNVNSILDDNLRVPQLIDPDDFSIVSYNKYGRFLLNIYIFVLGTLTALQAYACFNNTAKELKIMEFFILGLFFAIFVFFIIIRLSQNRALKVAHHHSKTYTRKYNLVYHPFSKKLTTREKIDMLIEVLRSVGSFKK